TAPMLSTCVGQQVTAHFGGLRFRSVHACGSGTFCAGSALPRARATQLSKRGAAAPGPQCCRGMVTVLRVARVVYASGCGGHQVRCAAYGGGVVAASGLCRVSFVCRWACRHGGGFRCRVGVLHPEMAGAGRCGRGHTAGFRIFCCAQASATCGRGPFLAVVRASVVLLAEATVFAWHLLAFMFVSRHTSEAGLRICLRRSCLLLSGVSWVSIRNCHLIASEDLAVVYVVTLFEDGNELRDDQTNILVRCADTSYL
ncbi:hypothetical protein TraAM80_03140, partial [Trypanosoma rangeli]